MSSLAKINVSQPFHGLSEQLISEPALSEDVSKESANQNFDSAQKVDGYIQLLKNLDAVRCNDVSKNNRPTSSGKGNFQPTHAHT